MADMNCMVCAEPHTVAEEDADMGYKLVCGECNENFEGVFVGDHPVFYAPYTVELAEAFAHEATVHNDTRVFGWTMADFARDTTVICPCPRGETRWGGNPHQH